MMGVTRERVRQREQRFRSQINERAGIWTPALHRVVRLAAKLTPVTFPQFVQALTQRRLIPEGFSIESVLSIAEFFGQPIQANVEYALIASGERLPTECLSVARRLVTRWGLTTIDEVCAELAPTEQRQDLRELVRLVLEAQDTFCWLDRSRGWFWLRDTSRNRLLNQIEKIVAVAASVTVSDLREGVGRHHRMDGFRPPRDVLVQLCESSGLYRRRGDRIEARADLPNWEDILGQNESALVAILLNHGPIMTRERLERLAVDQAGLKRNSFYAYLNYSPVIARLAPGVYGLRGAAATAAEVDALIPDRARTQVLQDHGWTSTGALWIGYKISSAGARSGVLGIPGAIKPLVQGSYELATERGQHAGALNIKSSVWGLSPYYRRHSIEAGDHLVLVLNLQYRQAVVHAGTRELLLRFQGGE